MNTAVINEANATSAAELLLGDVRALAAQLGSPTSVADGSLPVDHWVPAQPATPAALREFLETYEREILLPQEWPVICRAYDITARGCWRELIELDRDWSTRSRHRPFAEASVRVGRRQLSRLRPLRDHRVVQRYLAAVEAGEARGWHVLVYGVALAAFGIPLRQGLINYADQTLGGFVEGAPTTAGLTDTTKLKLLEEVSTRLPASLAGLLPALAGTSLQAI